MKTQPKRPFRRPILTSEGTVADLTSVGSSNPENDCMGGSVYPPGHDDGCPPGNGGNGNGRGGR